jgi:hypothetical protein
VSGFLNFRPQSPFSNRTEVTSPVDRHRNEKPIERYEPIYCFLELIIPRRVFAAFRADAPRFAGPLLRAADFTWAETFLDEADFVLSLGNAFNEAHALFFELSGSSGFLGSAVGAVASG